MSKLSLTEDASDDTVGDQFRQRLNFVRENRRRNTLAQVDSWDDEIVEGDNAEEVLEDDPSENFFFVGPPGPPGFIPMNPRMHPSPIYVPPPPPRGPYTPNNPSRRP